MNRVWKHVVKLEFLLANFAIYIKMGTTFHNHTHTNTHAPVIVSRFKKKTSMNNNFFCKPCGTCQPSQPSADIFSPTPNFWHTLHARSTRSTPLPPHFPQRTRFNRSTNRSWNIALWTSLAHNIPYIPHFHTRDSTFRAHFWRSTGTWCASCRTNAEKIISNRSRPQIHCRSLFLDVLVASVWHVVTHLKGMGRCDWVQNATNPMVTPALQTATIVTLCAVCGCKSMWR